MLLMEVTLIWWRFTFSFGEDKSAVMVVNPPRHASFEHKRWRKRDKEKQATEVRSETRDFFRVERVNLG